MKNLKILGLALVAMFAMSTVVASAASAVEFKSESSPTRLTGEQKAETNDVFTTRGGTITCEHTTYVGSMTGTASTELEVEPTYSGCTAFGFAGVEIHMNGCRFRFTSSGSIHIICPEGKSIEVTVPGCTITYGPQTPTGGTVTYTNLGSGTTRNIAGDVESTGLHYIEDKRTLFPSCESPGVTTTDGTYRANPFFIGENENGVRHGIWVE